MLLELGLLIFISNLLRKINSMESKEETKKQAEVEDHVLVQPSAGELLTPAKKDQSALRATSGAASETVAQAIEQVSPQHRASEDGSELQVFISHTKKTPGTEDRAVWIRRAGLQ